ncbi:cystatin 10-like [Megalops cyprinoides]|uniref:cystatin 10-like n=1 Tax=Megalops cyprinoides TaxID=118141 RepID=UPI0018655CDC|nr:cystatin 10-like [Megalops cyprinoides]
MALLGFRSVLLCVIGASAFTSSVTDQPDMSDPGIPGNQTDWLVLRAWDPNAPGAREAVDFAVDTYNSKSTEEYLYKVVNFRSKLLQVVIGEEYILQAVIGLTSCRKGQGQNLNDCALKGSKGPNYMLRCRFVVLVWKETKLLLQSICRQTS